MSVTGLLHFLQMSMRPTHSDLLVAEPNDFASNTDSRAGKPGRCNNFEYPLYLQGIQISWPITCCLPTPNIDLPVGLLS